MSKLCRQLVCIIYIVFLVGGISYVEAGSWEGLGF